jgi:hypothetical protein
MPEAVQGKYRYRTPQHSRQKPAADDSAPRLHHFYQCHCSITRLSLSAAGAEDISQNDLSFDKPGFAKEAKL